MMQFWRLTRLLVFKPIFLQAFDKLKEYQTLSKDWIFGYLTYDLKNAVENLKSSNFDGLEFPDLYFFQPKKLFFIKGNKVEMQYLKMVDDAFENDLKEIKQINESTYQQSQQSHQNKTPYSQRRIFRKNKQNASSYSSR